jgi:hypothetical protein
MPIIYLKHPVHGTKVANMEAEAEFDEQNGWTRYNIDTPSSVVEVAEPEVAEAASDAPKRGRRRKAEEPAVPEFLAPQADQGE